MGDLGGLWCGDNFVPVYPLVPEKNCGRPSHVYLTHTSASPSKDVCKASWKGMTPGLGLQSGPKTFHPASAHPGAFRGEED